MISARREAIGPWAPTMRQSSFKDSYHLALGEFLVAFNSVENWLSDILTLALVKAERPDLADRIRKEPFAQRVTALELISMSREGLESLPFSDMIALAKERNTFAHGHLDIDLEGEYSLRDIKKDRHRDVDPQAIIRLAQSAREVAEKLRQAQAVFWFENLD